MSNLRFPFVAPAWNPQRRTTDLTFVWLSFETLYLFEKIVFVEASILQSWSHHFWYCRIVWFLDIEFQLIKLCGQIACRKSNKMKNLGRYWPHWVSVAALLLPSMCLGHKAEVPGCSCRFAAMFGHIFPGHVRNYSGAWPGMTSFWALKATFLGFAIGNQKDSSGGFHHSDKP